MNKIEEIALKNGFNIIETTEKNTGYPSHLMKAIIGFDSFDKAEKLAKEHGLDIEVFTRRDGWKFWYRTGEWALGPFERSSEDYGDDFLTFSKGDADTFYEDEVQPMVSGFENFDDLRCFLDRSEEIYNKIKDAGEDELVVSYQGSYYETIKKTEMEYGYDTHHYAIGLIDRNN